MPLNRYLVKCRAVGALGGLLFGFDTAVIAGTTQSLTAVFHLTAWQLGVTVSSALASPEGFSIGVDLGGPNLRVGAYDRQLQCLTITRAEWRTPLELGYCTSAAHLKLMCEVELSGVLKLRAATR